MTHHPLYFDLLENLDAGRFHSVKEPFDQTLRPHMALFSGEKCTDNSVAERCLVLPGLRRSPLVNRSRIAQPHHCLKESPKCRQATVSTRCEHQTCAVHLEARALVPQLVEELKRAGVEREQLCSSATPTSLGARSPEAPAPREERRIQARLPGERAPAFRHPEQRMGCRSRLRQRARQGRRHPAAISG